MAQPLYIINFGEMHINKANALYIIIAKAVYSLRLMIYAYGDNIHTNV